MSEPSAPRRYPSLSLVLLVLSLVCLVIFTLIAHGTFTSEEGSTWLGAGLTFFVASHLL
jgi:hypothetical protein